MAACGVATPANSQTQAAFKHLPPGTLASPHDSETAFKQSIVGVGLLFPFRVHI